MKKKYYLVFALLIIILNLIFLLIRNNFIVGFPLPFYTVTFEGAKCSNGVCPQVLLPKLRFHILNLVVDVFFWILIFVIFRRKLSNRKSGKNKKL